MKITRQLFIINYEKDNLDLNILSQNFRCISQN